MDAANLLPLSGEVEPTIHSRTMRVLVMPDLAQPNIHITTAGLRLLTSIHERRIERELIRTVPGVWRLAPDNPFLSAVQREQLDERGLIRECSVLEADSILASVVYVPSDTAGKGPPDLDMEWASDDSERTPFGWEGARVTAVEFEVKRAGAGGRRERFAITVRAERALEIGDVLLVGEEVLGTVAAFVPDGEAAADGPQVFVCAATGRRLGLEFGQSRWLAVGKAAQRARDVLRARNVGPYSLITLRPLGNSSRPGQPVTAEQVGWLAAHGLSANLAELTSLKSDDLSNRENLNAAVADPAWPERGTVPVPGNPESLFTLQATLQALGLVARLKVRNGCIELTLRPALDQELRMHSAGEIRKPETLNYKTFKDIEGGLFCPKVFGPTEGSRRRRFGHFCLPIPIVSPLWHLGSPSVLEQLLGLSEADVKQVVHWRAAVFLRGEEVAIVPIDAANSETDGEPLGSGAEAIRALLRRVPPGRLPAGLRDRLDAVIQETILILPPDLRPLVLLDSGNFATADVNDLYRRVINRGNRMRKLRDLNAPTAILRNESGQVQQAVDALFANGLTPNKATVMGSAGKPLVAVFDMAMAWLLDAKPKSVEWSARARLVVDAWVGDNAVLVPGDIYESLRLNESSPVLLTCPPNREGTFVAALPLRSAELVLRVSPVTYRRLLPAEASAPTAVLHRPLGRAARVEATWLLAVPPHKSPVSVAMSWVDAVDKPALFVAMTQAALEGRPVALSSPRSLLVAGVPTAGIVVPPDIEKSKQSPLQRVRAARR